MLRLKNAFAMIQGDDVPKQALYTDTWRFVIPEVYIRCPGCPMALNATVTTAPETTFDPAVGIVSQGEREGFCTLETGQWERSQCLI